MSALFESVAQKNLPATVAAGLIHTYIQAKDENYPHLIGAAFAGDAVVEMQVRSKAISFPARMEGVEPITDTLVRDFGRCYDNVHTFCLQAPVDPLAELSFTCDWLVAMTDRVTGAGRAGCGRYHWRFERGYQWRISHLLIEIEVMDILPADQTPALLDWAGRLAYPWTSIERTLRAMPRLDGLAPLRGYFEAAALR